MSTNLLRAYLNGSNLFEFPELTGKQLNSASSGNSLCYVYRENNIKTLSMQNSKYMNWLVCLPSVGRIRRKGIICESVRPRSLVAVIVTV